MLRSVVFVFSLSLVFANEELLLRFTSGNRQFSADVHKAVSATNEGKNFLVCPFSAETILALTQSGAKAETRDEIRSTLNLPNTTEDINSVFKSLLPVLTKSDESSFKTANKIYVKENYPIKAEFSSVATEVYQCNVENIDFSESDKAIKTMNDWVSQQTNDKIRNLIEPGTVTADTDLVLINALYFKGAWAMQFKKFFTKKTNFYRTTEEVVEVDMMNMKGEFFNYYESEELGAKFLELRFKGGRNIKMVVVLPNEKEGLKTLEGQIDQVYAKPNFTWEYVDVSLPKFKVETKIDFKKILIKLGVKKAFTRADFSGIAGTEGEIAISDVVQKAFISVDENGVEAAAATAVLIRGKSLMVYFGEKRTFVADHPFLFYVKYNDIVIFTGRVVSPAV